MLRKEAHIKPVNIYSIITTDPELLSCYGILMSFNTEQLSVVRTQGDDLVHYCKYQTLDRDKMVVVRMLRALGYFHTVPDSRLWRNKNLCGIFIYYEQQQPGAAQVVYTHRTSCRRGWPRGLGVQSSLLNIFSVSGGSSPRTNLFTKVVTLPQSRAQNLSDI